jgi:hypothetical protein
VYQQCLQVSMPNKQKGYISLLVVCHQTFIFLNSLLCKCLCILRAPVWTQPLISSWGRLARA